MIEFFVHGTPAPQGSKRHVGGGRMVEMSKKLPAWRKAIITTATRHAPQTPIDHPVAVTANFYLPRPQKPRFNRPAVPADADKLARALGDGLQQAGILKDDARIVTWHIHKHYAQGDNTGAHITIEETP